jgi:hypothetical protein
MWWHFSNPQKTPLLLSHALKKRLEKRIQKQLQNENVLEKSEMNETNIELGIDLNKVPKGLMKNHIDPWKDYDEEDLCAFLKYVNQKIQTVPRDAHVVVYGKAPTPVAMRVGALLYSMCDNVSHSLDFHGRKEIIVSGEVM